VKAMQSPITRETLHDSGSENISDTAEQFTAYLTADFEKWTLIIQSLYFEQ